MHLPPLLLECGERDGPIKRCTSVRLPAISLALVPEFHALGGNERADELVVLLLARVAAEGFPAVMSLANANDEARVRESCAVAASDQVVSLKNNMAIVRITVALRDAVVVEVSENASPVAGYYDLAAINIEYLA